MQRHAHAAVAEIEPELNAKVLEAGRTLDNFNEGNDPHHEADISDPLDLSSHAFDMR